MQVQITGVGGNTAANATWTITVLSADTFSLNSSTGNGTYTANTGTWAAVYTPAAKPSVTIGGAAQGAGNTIGSNTKDGIHASGGGNTGLVILGNIVGGGVFVGGLYWVASPVRRASAPNTVGTGTRPVLLRSEQTP